MYRDDSDDEWFVATMYLSAVGSEYPPAFAPTPVAKIPSPLG